MVKAINGIWFLSVLLFWMIVLIPMNIILIPMAVSAYLQDHLRVHLKVMFLLLMLCGAVNSQTLSIDFDNKKSTTVVDGKFTVVYSSWAIRGIADNKALTISRTVKTYKIYTKQIDGSNFDIGLIFSVKPSTNMFQFDVDAPSDYAFYYQPELTREEKDMGASRPDNVIGSYAVYDKKTRQKVYHIYRPLLIDSKGEKKWAEMSYEKGLIKVNCDRKWLDNASYPVTLDPTIGRTSIGASDNAFNNTYTIFCGAFTMPEDGTATAYKVCVWDNIAGTHYIKMALFTKTGADSYALVENSSTGAILISQTTRPTTDGEFTSGAITATLVSGTDYYTSYQTTNDSIPSAFDTTTPQARRYVASNYDTYPPATYSSTLGGDGNCHSAYITYTTGGGETTKTMRIRRAQIIGD